MLALYLMDGFQIVAGQFVGLVGLEWHVVGLGDFNGDGRSDILSRRNDGTLALHLMDGFACWKPGCSGRSAPSGVGLVSGMPMATG